MKKISICFVAGSNPDFLGGISLFLNNLISYFRTAKFGANITWVYKGNKNRSYSKGGIRYVELAVSKRYPLDEIQFNFKVKSFLYAHQFDIINSHASWGYWMKNFEKNDRQIKIHVYHGTSYYFFRNHLKRKNLIKKVLSLIMLFFSFFIEKPPIKKADKIICVSEKVKRQIIKLYGKRENIFVIRNGVNLKDFKLRNKKKIIKKLKLNKNHNYGLYIGGGGYWTKGLDRAIKISDRIYKLDKNYRLIVIGPDFSKIKSLINKEFVIFLEGVPRKDIPFYYNVSNFFFCISRYDGGAPTLVVSEAMASGCLVVCSKSAKQEIIEDEKNGLIINDFSEEEAKKILKTIKDEKRLKNILNNAIKDIKGLSLNKWGKKYIKIFK